MNYIAREQIKQLFNNPQNRMVNGLWFSGYRREGEYKSWYENGKLYRHCFYKNDELDGEYKMWKKYGQLYVHQLYKNGKLVKDYLK